MSFPGVNTLKTFCSDQENVLFKTVKNIFMNISSVSDSGREMDFSSSSSLY